MLNLPNLKGLLAMTLDSVLSQDLFHFQRFLLVCKNGIARQLEIDYENIGVCMQS